MVRRHEIRLHHPRYETVTRHSVIAVMAKAADEIHLSEKRVRRQVLSLVEIIASNVDLCKVLDHLVSKSHLVSQSVRDQINHRAKPIERCRLLLSYLARNASTSTPFLDFRAALEACGYPQVVEFIDDEVPVLYVSPSPSKLISLYRIR